MSVPVITRKMLYDELWSEATARVAKRFGISDVGLAKLCRKHNIPRPPRGYWAKKQSGQTPPQTPLPNPDSDYEIRFLTPNGSLMTIPESKEAERGHIPREAGHEPKIAVADSLRGAHDLVRQANQELRHSATDSNRLIVPPNPCALKIRVAKPNLRRALLIMDALLKTLQDRRLPVAPGPSVTIRDSCVTFAIEESLETQREQPKQHDLKGPYSFGHSRFVTKRIPTGRLTLQINASEAYWARGCQRNWRDSSKQRLEDRLNEIVEGLIDFASRQKEHQLELERQAQEQRERDLRRQEEARLREEKRAEFRAEQQRVEALLQQAHDWRRSQDLRHFIETAERNYRARHASIEPGSEFELWLEWALRQADRLDPLAESPRSILDEILPDEPDASRIWPR